MEYVCVHSVHTREQCVRPTQVVTTLAPSCRRDPAVERVPELNTIRTRSVELDPTVPRHIHTADVTLIFTLRRRLDEQRPCHVRLCVSEDETFPGVSARHSAH